MNKLIYYQFDIYKFIKKYKPKGHEEDWFMYESISNGNQTFFCKMMYNNYLKTKEFIEVNRIHKFLFKYKKLWRKIEPFILGTNLSEYKKIDGTKKTSE